MPEQIHDIPIKDISVDWGWNSRKEISEDNVRSLASSIEEHGLENPIVVRPIDQGYSLVSGFRRMKAFMVLGRDTIQCFVRKMNDYEAKIANFRENGDREQLTFWEEVLFIKETFPKEIRITQIQRELNRPYEWVRARRQIWKLPKIFIELAEKGVYSATNIRDLLNREPIQQQAAAKHARTAYKRGENPKQIRKSSLRRRHVQGRKNMSRMMNIIEENSLCSDPRLNDILLWAMGEFDKLELADRLEVGYELFENIEE